MTRTFEEDDRHHPDAWMLGAACRGMSSDLFFPTDGNTLGRISAICTGCAVREQCLEYALDHGIVHGTWGGISERGRARLLRHRNDPHPATSDR